MCVSWTTPTFLCWASRTLQTWIPSSALLRVVFPDLPSGRVAIRSGVALYLKQLLMFAEYERGF